MAEWQALDKFRLRRSFGGAVNTYDAVAVLQREIADRLLARLDLVRLQPRLILDLGCGTGYVLRQLADRYRRAHIVGLDFAEGMALRARAQLGWFRRWTGRNAFVCADAERVPLADASVDMVVSNLALQWCDPRLVFAEARRVLRPGGLIMFATFGPDTLRELRESWREADDAPHVHQFIDMHDLGDMLVNAHFADPVMDMENFTLTYDDVHGVMRDIKQLGAHNVALTRARGLMGKARFTRFRQAYAARARSGKIPATYEAVYGHAWAPEGEPKASHEAQATIPVDRIRRSRR